MIRDWILELLFPSKCVFCRKLLSKQETEMCSHCRAALPYCDNRSLAVGYAKTTIAALYYEDTVRRAVIRYKFHGAVSYAAPFGRLLAMSLIENGVPFDIITYAPVSRRRRRKRGYDQAELLAREVSRELGIPMDRLLEKQRDNPKQSGISSPDARRANVLGVYRAVNTDLLYGKNILIIDDVLTTGATLGECCRTLLDAGAAQVSCGTFAAVRKNSQ